MAVKIYKTGYFRDKRYHARLEGGLTLVAPQGYASLESFTERLYELYKGDVKPLSGNNIVFETPADLKQAFGGIIAYRNLNFLEKISFKSKLRKLNQLD